MIYSRWKYYCTDLSSKPSNINTIERPLLQNRSILQELLYSPGTATNLIYMKIVCIEVDFEILTNNHEYTFLNTFFIILMFIFRCSFLFTVCFFMIHVFNAESFPCESLIAVLRRAGQEFHRHSRGDGRWGEGSGYQGGWAEDPGHFGFLSWLKRWENMGEYDRIWEYIYI